MELDNARDSIHAAGDYVAITAKVKSACRGVNIETATLEDLTEETWNNRVERLLLQLWKKTPGYNLSVVLERIINISKRPICFMDDPVSPAERKTRPSSRRFNNNIDAIRMKTPATLPSHCRIDGSAIVIDVSTCMVSAMCSTESTTASTRVKKNNGLSVLLLVWMGLSLIFQAASNWDIS